MNFRYNILGSLNDFAIRIGNYAIMQGDKFKNEYAKNLWLTVIFGTRKIMFMKLSVSIIFRLV